MSPRDLSVRRLFSTLLFIPVIFYLSLGSAMSQVVSLNTTSPVDQKASSWSHDAYAVPLVVVSDMRPYKGQGIPEDLILPCGTDLPVWPSGVSAMDSEGSPLDITTNERVQFTPCGGKEYFRNWNANINGELITFGTQRITFHDESAPVIKVPSDIVVQTTNAVPFPSYEATDDGCSTFQVYFEETEIESKSAQYRLIRNWTIVDGCGNTSSAKQTIYVEQSIPKEPRQGEPKTVKP